MLRRLVGQSASMRKQASWYGCLAIGLFLLIAAILSAREPSEPSRRELPLLQPFLEYFASANKISVKTDDAQWIGATGHRQGYLARADEDAALPALILIADETGLREWFKHSARELASIGYVVLAVEFDVEGLRDAADPVVRQRLLADLTAAVGWLRNREDVLPKQIGVVGWGKGGSWALQLASATSLEACVTCDSPLVSDSALLTGLRHTAVMTVVSGSNRKAATTAFTQSLKKAHIEHLPLSFPDAQAGFMDATSQRNFRFDQAERAWFEIYEFFAKHVEDAPLKALLADKVDLTKPTSEQFATISDLMKAVNTPQGLRGELARALANEPKDDAAWKHIQAQATLMAEAGSLLYDRTAPRGSQASWQRLALSYRGDAASIAAAAKRRDYSATREALTQLSTRCGACHLKHR